MRGTGVARSGKFSGTFDRWRLTRYYNSSTMTPSGLHAYLPLLIYLLVAAFLAGALLAVSTLIGWRRPSKVKSQPYECGITPTGDAREPFSVKFYLVAMVFILFDVEAIFLYPWAYIFKDLAKNAATRWFGFIEMMFYVAILLVGYIYLWKKGALDWHKSRK
jgi:NADH-quinone oxidoreductase subunit A